MWVDIVLVAILIISVIQGFRHGFVQTFIYAIGWIIALVLGFIWYPHIIKFLKDKTDFYDAIHSAIIKKISENTDLATESLINDLPKMIQDFIEKALETATNAITLSIANSLSDILFAIIGFLIIVITIKLTLLIITRMFSKKSKNGLVGCFDGFLGLLAGGLKGIFLIYLLLALLIPITSLTDLAPFIMGELNQSVLGKYLYDNNLLLMLIQRFL